MENLFCRISYIRILELYNVYFKMKCDGLKKILGK